MMRERRGSTCATNFVRFKLLSLERKLKCVENSIFSNLCCLLSWPKSAEAKLALGTESLLAIIHSLVSLATDLYGIVFM